MDQGSFELPELDKDRTKAAVESALEKYRIFKTILFEERETSITASYSDAPRSNTNVTSDPTAQAAIHNVDVPAERRAFCDRVERAVKRLHPKERLLIEERYMKSDYVFDYVVYNQLFNPPISHVTYGRIRWKAFYKLALALNIQVLK